MGVLLVTGGSRGIGAGICKLAAERGWSVGVNYASSDGEANKVVDDIRAKGGKAIAVKADVSKMDQVEAMYAKLDAEFGPVNALINNAGINGGGFPVDELDADKTLRMFEVNTLGVFVCAKEALRRMSKKHGGDGGVIVNISSAAAKHGGPGSYRLCRIKSGCGCFYLWFSARTG